MNRGRNLVYVLVLVYVQGVPHHIGLSIGLAF